MYVNVFISKLIYININKTKKSLVLNYVIRGLNSCISLKLTYFEAYSVEKIMKITELNTHTHTSTLFHGTIFNPTGYTLSSFVDRFPDGDNVYRATNTDVLDLLNILIIFYF